MKDAKRRNSKFEKLQASLRPGEETCKGCRQNKPKEDFVRLKRSKMVQHASCNSCDEKNNARRKDERAAVVEDKIGDWKKAGGCPGPEVNGISKCLIHDSIHSLQDTLEDDDIYCVFLDYDHNDGGATKESGISSMKNPKNKKRKMEKKKTVLRCVICHKYKTKFLNEYANNRHSPIKPPRKLRRPHQP